MKSVNGLTLMIVVLGALNWGLLGLFQLDVAAAVFGGPQATLSRVTYIVVGLAGIYQLIPLIAALSGEAEDPQDAAPTLSTPPPAPTGTVYQRTTTQDREAGR